MNLEKSISQESISSQRILEIAAEISPLLGKYHAGIFGGIAVCAYSGGRREVHDVDVVCPEETIDDLSRVIAAHLKSVVKISPAGFDVDYVEDNKLLFLEIMACHHTESGLVLPFGVITHLPLQFQWQTVARNNLLVVSKEILREMKTGSNRDKDQNDLLRLIN